MVKILIGFLFLMFIASGSFSNSYAASIKDEYELQERCGKTARGFIKLGYGNGVSKTRDGQQETAYVNHYNKKLNKCFVIISLSNYVLEKDHPEYVKSFVKTLLDVNENKEYGKYINDYQPQKMLMCEVEGRHCLSPEGWEALIRPYMND